MSIDTITKTNIIISMSLVIHTNNQTKLISLGDVESSRANAGANVALAESDARFSKVSARTGPAWITPAVLCGLAMPGMALANTIMTNNVMADDVIDEINLSVPISCTLVGVGMDTHVVTLRNGQANSNVGETTINAYCNDVNGFAIYAIGFTDDTEGKNVLTDSTLGSEHDIITGTATGPISNVDTSNWAMKVTTTATDAVPAPTYPITIQNSYDSFHTVPDSYALVAKRNSGTDIGTGAEGSLLKTTYQVYVSNTQLAGTYNGRVKYTLVHPNTAPAPYVPQAIDCDAGKICYNTNAGPTETEGTMAKQSANNNATVTLYPSNFSREGYGFAGWSDKYDYATNPEANFYGPNEDITTPSNLSTKGLSLYAVWIKSEGSIQDTTKVAEVCNRLTQSGPGITKTLNSVSALTDQRDGNTYAIAKLADGKCWMIENLRLGNTAEHNSDGTLAQGYGTSATYGNFGGLADPESTGFTYTYSANSLYSNDGSNNTINIGTSNYPAYRMPRYNNFNTSARGTNTTTDQNIYSYGNYYTWHAAIADLTYNGTNNQSTTGTSLCPTGWRLPKGGDKSNEANNEFWALITTGLNNGTKPANYDGNTQPYYTGTPEGSDVSKLTRNFPNNFLYSGFFYTSSAFYRGSYDSYWSSTANNNDYSYYLSLDSSRVFPGTYYSDKYYGHSIRCVAGS